MTRWGRSKWPGWKTPQCPRCPECPRRWRQSSGKRRMQKRQKLWTNPQPPTTGPSVSYLKKKSSRDRCFRPSCRARSRSWPSWWRSSPWGALATNWIRFGLRFWKIRPSSTTTSTTSVSGPVSAPRSVRPVHTKSNLRGIPNPDALRQVCRPDEVKVQQVVV